MPAKSVLVICGTGVATSTVVATSIREHCSRRGIDVDVRQGKVMDLLGDSPNVDLIVSTTQIPKGIDTPVIGGLPFLTGVGVDALLEQIVGHLTA